MNSRPVANIDENPPPSQLSSACSRPQMPKGPVTDWSIEDVIQFIAHTDPTLGGHATVFREHVSIFVCLAEIGRNMFLQYDFLWFFYILHRKSMARHSSCSTQI